MKTPYVPDLGIVYPKEPDGRMVPVNPIRDVIVDENYPFLNKSLGFKIMRVLLYIAGHTIWYLVCFLLYGIKIEGRKNLRKHRKLFKNGAMTISNHVHRWDFFFIMFAIRYRMSYYPVYKEHLKGKDEPIIRYGGGIPIPEDLRAMKKFNLAFDEIHQKKKWIHAYPESSRFDFFQPIRPFKKGVFTMAWRYDLPVIPIAISYRKSHFPFTIINFFRSLKGGPKLPLITIRVGEPILPDKNPELSTDKPAEATRLRKEAVQKLRKESHEAVVRLAGITNNPYPAEGD